MAFIHDELVRRGGAERVFEELISLFPSADIFSLYSGRHPFITVNNKTYPVQTSFLQTWSLWFRRHPGRLLPFLLQAAEQFDFSQYDLVISSASGFAKAIVTRSTIPHISYIHTPTRYLWDATHEVVARAPKLTRWPLQILFHYLRLADFACAQRADVFLANSHYTQVRIDNYYRRNSEVVYPPIDTAFFTPGGAEKSSIINHRPFLLVGRLTPSKHFDQAITVCEKLQLPLAIIGVGSDMNRLKKIAGKHTRFLGKVSPQNLRKLYREARALIQPGVEDFGMASAEALACGTPVIAYGYGGIQEIVTGNAFGVLYHTQRTESLADAVRQFMAKESKFAPHILQAQARRFSSYRFAQQIKKIVEQTLREGKP